ncbi:MAG TPA: hypothetical protein PK362_10855, partial [Elusimicrobiota bacterium]|nr:hypothetical protein [Elusimicrobiota bacterium]
MTQNLQRLLGRNKMDNLTASLRGTDAFIDALDAVTKESGNQRTETAQKLAALYAIAGLEATPSTTDGWTKLFGDLRHQTEDVLNASGVSTEEKLDRLQVLGAKLDTIGQITPAGTSEGIRTELNDLKTALAAARQQVTEPAIDSKAQSESKADLDHTNVPANDVSAVAPTLLAESKENASQTETAVSQNIVNSQGVEANQDQLSLAASQDNTGDAATVGTETPRPDNGRKQRRGYGKKQNVDVEERLVDSVVPGAGETSGETVETPVETLNAVERELVGDRNAAKTSAVQAGATRFNIFESYLAPLQSGNRAQRALYWAMGGFVMPFVEEAAFRFGVFAEAGQALFGGTGFDLASVAGDTVLFGALFAGLHSVVEMSVIARQNGGGIKGWTSAISDRSVWANFGQRLVFSGAMTAVY